MFLPTQPTKILTGILKHTNKVIKQYLSIKKV